jgi:multidrug transporter EmrE-like cation transporter
VLSLCKKNATTKQNDKDFSLYPHCEEQAKFPKKSYLYGLFLAVAVFLINQLVTLSTPMIQAVVLFSIACGGATVISAIVGAVMYKEKLTPLTLIGLVLGIGSLILLKV